MVLSKACTYGVLASFYVAREQNSGYVSIREMSEDLNISFHFLTKILQKLTAYGLMTSHKGPKGGISLAKQPDKITLLEIIAAIDGDEIFHECILGLPGCGHERPCPIHDYWAKVRSDMEEMFAGRTLADTAEGLEQIEYRLKLPVMSTRPPRG